MDFSEMPDVLIEFYFYLNGEIMVKQINSKGIYICKKLNILMKDW